MAVKIRLARHGAKKRPYYRIVVADARAPRDGKFIEEVGRYNPCVDPSMIKFDLEKVDKWIASRPIRSLVFLKPLARKRRRHVRADGRSRRLG